MGLIMRPIAVESPVDKNPSRLHNLFRQMGDGPHLDDRSGPAICAGLVAARDRREAAGHAHRRPGPDARRGQGTVRGGLMVRLGRPARDVTIRIVLLGQKAPPKRGRMTGGLTALTLIWTALCCQSRRAIDSHCGF
jgi:hypothetical protein